MFSVRIHGRGGQGAVTSAETLSVAAFDQGLHAQAFPSFGSERTGAPVVAFCRIDDLPIRAHDPVSEPDAVIVQDPTLMRLVPVLAGIPAGGFVLVNSSRPFPELGIDDLVSGLDPGRLVTVPATDLSRRVLGRALPNTALLGGFAALTGVVSLAAVQDAIRQRFGGEVGQANAEVARLAHAHVRLAIGGGIRA
ncbi:2-oxoacid:acceptor oxidoreductase family protein [Nocardioides astragali]|uniref:2-oxoacid:acceptor oxidoreductase family protein n=1 Tax=Nocardioides astragali TaxID=1776736 RepID=A0ABW2NB65_9ACTN|nr:2-oxoacid:acceptor oxidoreductase family protein [Nocardioides astragali]